jgi:ion channel-forming bestrophin family protein
MAALIAAIHRVLPPLKIKWRLFSSMAVLAVYGWFVIWAVQYEHLPHIEWGAESTVVNGLVLSFLIAFRNNHAYDRWWEARKLWGQLINENRNLVMKVRALQGLAPADRQRIGALLIAFAEALKDHLRGDRGLSPAQSPAAPLPQYDHEPSRLAASLYETVLSWHREERADGWTLLWLDGHLKSLMDICGACERIRNTPLSSSYRALLRHGIALYLLVSPFYLIEDIGPATLPMFMIAAYFLIGIEMVAAEIEEPFGEGGDNLPLERYCATVAASVREILSPN